eukprot:3530818-Rhodomonas_salina.2
MALLQAAEAALGALREREEESERGSEREGAATQGGREGRKKGVLGGCGVEVRQADVLEERALLSDVDIAFCYRFSAAPFCDAFLHFACSSALRNRSPLPRDASGSVSVSHGVCGVGAVSYRPLHALRPLSPPRSATNAAKSNSFSAHLYHHRAALDLISRARVFRSEARIGT